ncbi:MAG: glycosyltransferase family 4 protein [Candidatus Pacebacteria bacterium]|nr:glycosyltransferase family 4 protein [Candidatus Paceibacterota bacterium]
MDEKLKVAMLATRYSPPHFRGGEEHVVHELRREFLQRGHAPYVFARTLNKWRDLDACSTSQDVTRFRVWDIPVVTHLQFARRVREVLPEYNCDMILNMHAIAGYALTVSPHIVVAATTSIGEAAAVYGNSPLRWLERLLRRTLSYRLEKRVLSTCTHVVCVSDHIRREVEQWFGVPADRLSVIGNGVDADHFRPPEKEIWSGCPPRILFVGRLVNRKNVSLLLAAARILQREAIDFEILIAGDGPDRHSLQEQATAMGLHSRTTFAGRKAASELLKCYQSSDIFVLPSRYEGMPLVLLEAMACGLPTIACNFTGVRDIIRHGHNGFVADEGTPECVAEYLRQLLADKARAKTMGRQARNDVLRQFTWKQVADQYLQLMTKLREET